ncbi:unnamed protein product, partial [Prorocentrum cordatum]
RHVGPRAAAGDAGGAWAMDAHGEAHGEVHEEARGLCGLISLIACVKIAASYDLALGLLTALSALVGNDIDKSGPVSKLPPAELRELLTARRLEQWLYMFGMVIGFQALQGIQRGEPLRIKALGLYHLLRMAMCLPWLLMFEAVACDVLRLEPAKDRPTCQSVRDLLLEQSVLTMLTHVWVASLSRSLALKMQAVPQMLEDGVVVHPASPALQALQSPLLAHADQRVAVAERPPLQRLRHSAEPARVKYAPFTGTPLRLD